GAARGRRLHRGRTRSARRDRARGLRRARRGDPAAQARPGAPAGRGVAVTPRIAVVGGGLAGLAAGIRCADRGAEVTLFEARPRLGGATWSTELQGLRVDNGQHVFLRCCTEYIGFLERLGVLDRTVIQPRLEIPVLSPGRKTSFLRRAPLPAPLHL